MYQSEVFKTNYLSDILQFEFSQSTAWVEGKLRGSRDALLSPIDQTWMLTIQVFKKRAIRLRMINEHISGVLCNAGRFRCRLMLLPLETCRTKDTGKLDTNVVWHRFSLTHPLF